MYLHLSLSLCLSHVYPYRYLYPCRCFSLSLYTYIYMYLFIHIFPHICLFRYVSSILAVYLSTYHLYLLPLSRSLSIYYKTTQRVYIYIYTYNPPCNFLYKIATVKLGKMLRFRALLCLGVPTQCQRLQYYRGPWHQRFYRDFMLNTALSTSQLIVLGATIL